MAQDIQEMIKAKPWEKVEGWQFLMHCNKPFCSYPPEVKRAFMEAQEKADNEEKMTDEAYNDAFDKLYYGSRYEERREYEAAAESYPKLPWWRRLITKRPIWEDVPKNRR